MNNYNEAYSRQSWFYKFKQNIRKYYEIAKINFKVQLIWRFDVVVNMMFTIIKILFVYILWKAIFGENDIVSGFTFNSMLSYYIISSFLSGIDMSRSTSEEICNRVKLGTFSKYMIIPIDTQNYFFAKNLGMTFFYLVFNLISAFVWIFIFKIDFAFTSNPIQILISILMIFLGLVFMIQLHFFIGILSFKFLEIGFFRMIIDNITEFVTGTMIPLVLLPEVVVTIMKFFPFYYTTYLPSMLLIGRNSNEAVQGLIIIALWVLFFFILNKIVYKRMRILFDGVGI
ncbi:MULTISPECIES: ABC-2 family transporter protein [unclassified Clostridioides]|uniref:ABC transporter permease n=1 Tax=unclassified Clostridioides TaxID=2635829 RepID=UPI001D12A252|nr:ABC-2 family transporter protein [Clostridioides sp. ZZV14-6150]MCC0660636.1 ABC-2 family transporter protein [Clostridioides sp. ZZV14-6154]MCC0720047.1 ABC-2 family transporter protein [Clostridioides sp. ZZV14-6105]MCC0724182.1 ABC-2 family transporter protein [Clostridioides sp. ZZV14-6104]MCC0727747.1 ABC-2 family transporter protein [Clostridioides sp. ZZV14-6045]MCC0732398.1 ABC-2 family transporter protein [Clostridioides sp. ZZV14-6048]MCC0736444.1 ABC-2 family transporter protein